MKKIYTFILSVIVVSLTACTQDIVYSQFSPISSGEWHVDSTARFTYTIDDTQLDYRMVIYVRHTERYPYQNMWLFVNNGEKNDTIEFYLADDRGRWLGDKHHGFIEMPVLLESNKQFPDTGIYTMQISHGMRDSILRGVMDVGLEIRGVEKE